MLRKILNFTGLIKKNDSLDVSIAQEGQPLTELQKQQNALEKKAQANKHILEISNFQKQSIETILNHLSNTPYVKHRILMKEINYLVYYTFCVLQDDFYKGDRIFKKGITKIDDYVFSQYRKKPELEFNIKKLTTLASSNRFDPNTHENFLAYFVFIEETGFELIMLLEDFYGMLINSEKKTGFDVNLRQNTIALIKNLCIIFTKSDKKTRFTLGFNKKFQLNKSYLKQDLPEKTTLEHTKFQTLMTQNLTERFSPAKAQIKILEDVLKNEKDNFIK